jgi:hypothetical protein
LIRAASAQERQRRDTAVANTDVLAAAERSAARELSVIAGELRVRADFELRVREATAEREQVLDRREEVLDRRDRERDETAWEDVVAMYDLSPRRSSSSYPASAAAFNSLADTWRQHGPQLSPTQLGAFQATVASTVVEGDAVRLRYVCGGYVVALEATAVAAAVADSGSHDDSNSISSSSSSSSSSSV